VIGHNPVLEDFALSLIGPGGDDDAARDMALKFPTGGLAHFRLDVDAFSEIAERRGQLLSFTAPRSLESD
jgi:phosphohistidine phosphatase